MLFGCHVYYYGPASSVETIQQIARKTEELGDLFHQIGGAGSVWLAGVYF